MPKINKYKALRLTNLDENLSKNEKLLYIHLILCFDENKGFAYPPYPELMQVLCVKRRNSVADTVDSLREKIYIETKKGYRGANNYYLLKHITESENITSNENVTSNRNDTSNESVTRTSNENDTSLVTKPLLNKVNNKLNNKLNKKEAKKVTNLDLLIDEYTTNENLKETLKDFLKMRKSIKSPMNDRALKMLFKKLDELSHMYELSAKDELKINILDQSIFNNWKGVFELKENKNIKPDIQEQPKGKVLDFKIGEC